ncbi:MAG TPA: hypothetical protein ENJ10_09445 [Caldithrix abyssi]|uniref:Doubled CXXCH motif domain-containing protein n=1 Tax=Caldithrix abyssi TaxID=187145 RepID=A0A7V1LMT6_CALAY|nr:hypothetical protein [Caldithrix abyssi]
MDIRKIVVTLLSIAFVSLLQAQDPEGCLASDCHGAYSLKEFVHPAMEDECASCHESIADNHPAGEGNEFELTAEQPEMCYDCHDENNTKKVLHSPVEDGECTSCHSPHSSDNEYMLLKAKARLCYDCHDSDISEGKFVHKPVKDQECIDCHSPHQSDQEYLLERSMPELCLDCHTDLEDVEDKESVHPPFEDECLACHNPHVSSVKNLLVSRVPVLCFDCHDPEEALPPLDMTVHGPLREKVDCSNCHSPHGTDFEPLLLKNKALLCMSCHNKEIKSKTGRVLASLANKVTKENNVHKPIREEGCTACHDVHGLERELLTDTFPAGNYKAGRVENYKLCFDCHKSGLLTKKETRTATGFRNGTENLHYLHVNREKGRSCINCHDVHGSGQPFLISEEVKFGHWNMPIVFTKTEQGGSCLAGCHEQKSYER